MTALEALELVAHLRATLAPDALRAVQRRVDAVAAVVRGRSAEQHRGTLCPLNARGLCQAYAARPLLCRGASSFDAGACERRGAAIPSYAALADAAQTAQEQLDDEGARATGRREILELSNALSIALALPDAAARWRRGEPIFRRAAHAWFEGDTLHTWTERARADAS